MSVFQKLFLDVVLAYVNRIYLFIIPKGTGVLVSHMLMLEMLVEAIPVNNYIVPRLGKTNRLCLSLCLYLSLPSPPLSLGTVVRLSISAKYISLTSRFINISVWIRAIMRPRLRANTCVRACMSALRRVRKVYNHIKSLLRLSAFQRFTICFNISRCIIFDCSITIRISTNRRLSDDIDPVNVIYSHRISTSRY